MELEAYPFALKPDSLLDRPGNDGYLQPDGRELAVGL
jgi:hypothetical protein